MVKKPKEKEIIEGVFIIIEVNGEKKAITANGEFQEKPDMPSIYEPNVLWDFYYGGRKFKALHRERKGMIGRVFIPDWDNLLYPKHKAEKINDNQWKVEYTTLSGIHLDDYYESEEKYVFDIEKMVVHCE